MREKLIELIKLSPTCICNLCGQEGALDEAAGVIADNLIANGVTIQQWIPVAERLPKHGDIVVCYIKNGEQDMLQWYEFENLWIGKQWIYKRHAVTHWMPLPEPPSGERRTDDERTG